MYLPSNIHSSQRNQVKRRLLGRVLITHDCVLTKRGNSGTETDIEKGRWCEEVQGEDMTCNPRRKTWNGSFPLNPWKETILLKPQFGLPALGPSVTISAVCASLCGNCHGNLSQPRHPSFLLWQAGPLLMEIEWTPKRPCPSP